MEEIIRQIIREVIREEMSPLLQQLNAKIDTVGEDKLMDTKDACAFLNMSPNTLKRHLVESDIYSISPGGKNQYWRSDLEKMIRKK